MTFIERKLYRFEEKMNGEKMSSTHEILIRDNMTKMAHIEMHARERIQREED